MHARDDPAELYTYRVQQMCVAGLLSLRTLVCKLVGVCFSMAGGLIAGKEGPFIHTGIVLGSASENAMIIESNTLASSWALACDEEWVTHFEPRPALGVQVRLGLWGNPG